MLIRLRPKLDRELGRRVGSHVALRGRDGEDGGLEVLGPTVDVAVGHGPLHRELAVGPVDQAHRTRFGDFDAGALAESNPILLKVDGALAPARTAEEAAHERHLGARVGHHRRHLRDRWVKELAVVVGHSARRHRHPAHVRLGLQLVRCQPMLIAQLAVQVLGHEARRDRHGPPLLRVARADQVHRFGRRVVEEHVDAPVVVARLRRREGEGDMRGEVGGHDAVRGLEREESVGFDRVKLERHRDLRLVVDLEDARRALARQLDDHVVEIDHLLGEDELGPDGLAGALDGHRVAAGRAHLVVVARERARHLGPELHAYVELAVGRDDAARRVEDEAGLYVVVDAHELEAREDERRVAQLEVLRQRVAGEHRAAVDALR